VQAALEIAPTTANLGNISRDSGPIKKTLHVKRGAGGPIDPKIKSTGSPHVEAELVAVQPGEHYELHLTASPPWPNGLLRGMLVMETGVERSPLERITVYGRVTPRLTAIPNRLTIPRRVDRALDLKSTLRWSSEKPGQVLEVTVNHPDLTVSIEEQRSRQVVVLHVPEGFDAGARPRMLVTLKTDDKDVPELKIPIYAMRQAMNRFQGAAGDRTRTKSRTQ
jgi:hypothetical protein